MGDLFIGSATFTGTVVTGLPLRSCLSGLTNTAGDCPCLWAAPLYWYRVRRLNPHAC